MSSRVIVERQAGLSSTDTLFEDVRRGLFSSPKTLPPKHLYDAEGGRLFEEICRLPEYYPTRTETALLAEVAPELVRSLRPETLVELGSGSSTKTRLLLDAMGALNRPARYVSLDLDETMLRQSAEVLAGRYPWLSVRARVADFEAPLSGLPRGAGTLVVFLGGTVGNLEQAAAVRVLSGLAAATGAGSSLLLGIDRIKDPARIAAAYDDAQGVTARFNLNLLQVLNRRLEASFDPRDFRHLAFYDRDAEQVEMHLVARRALEVRLQALELTARFAAGESVRTEISRKFSQGSARAMVERAGWTVRHLFSPPNEDFSLVWAVADGRGEDAPAVNPLAASEPFP
ncbi:MAG: L-histidine N(alpha)-methyltransferase [Myxococcales bacterium]